MPAISRFHGVTVYMYYRDHHPAHFHVRYQEYEITIEIESGLVKGTMPLRILKLIFAWKETYQKELRENWSRALEGKSLVMIPPPG